MSRMEGADDLVGMIVGGVACLLALASWGQLKDEYGAR